MRLTLGFAVYDDFAGAWMTLHGNLLLHGDSISEFVVVDNHPQSEHGKMVRDECAKIASGGWACRYVAMEHPTGTSVSRDRVFREATGDVVLCVDSHVLLPSGSLKRTLDWFAARPTCRDLVGGPMLYSDHRTISTHFNDVWRNEMRGVLALAFACSCGEPFTTYEPQAESPLAIMRGNFATGGVGYQTLVSQEQATACRRCGKAFPVLGWAGHESVLERLGYRMLGRDDDGEPFEVPAWGLGVFGCRRDA